MASFPDRPQIGLRCDKAKLIDYLLTVLGTTDSHNHNLPGARNSFDYTRKFQLSPMSVAAFSSRSIASKLLLVPPRVLPSAYPIAIRTSSRTFTTSKMAEEKFKPAKRVAGQRQDVWSIINEAAAASPKQPIVNMGQGFL